MSSGAFPLLFRVRAGPQPMLSAHSYQPQCFLATRSTLRPRHTAVLPAVTPSLNLTFGEAWGLENAEMRVYFSPISKTQISTLLGFSLPIPHVKRIASGCGTVSILWFLIAVRAQPCTQIGQAQFLSKRQFSLRNSALQLRSRNQGCPRGASPPARQPEAPPLCQPT